MIKFNEIDTIRFSVLSNGTTLETYLFEEGISEDEILKFTTEVFDLYCQNKNNCIILAAGDLAVVRIDTTNVIFDVYKDCEYMYGLNDNSLFADIAYSYFDFWAYVEPIRNIDGLYEKVVDYTKYH